MTWLPATVPGTVHTDLLNNKVIHDPFVGDQETALAWIGNSDWEYTRTFEISSEIMNEEEIELVFEGLDTYADIFLNENAIFSADNMHRTWRIACKPWLKLGDNVLRIRFRSPMQAALAAYNIYPFRLPSGNDAAEIKVSPFVRKAAYHFGWDFAPRMLTMGIWRPAYVDAWSGARIDHLHAVPKKFTVHKAEMVANIGLIVTESGKYTLRLDFGNGEYRIKSFQIERGEQQVQFPFTVHDPKYWWPRGMGPPNLTHLGLQISRDEKVLDARVQPLALRSIRLMQEKDKIGTSFYFSVNDFLAGGGPLFIKGANYVPADVFLPRGLEKRTHLLESAAAVGMNMLRVWGGGVYEDDAFYKWCDENGMLVWQDLPFACMMYPLEGAFLENARAELHDNVLRLQRHPSLAILCGNNEIDVAWHNWGWQAEGKFTPEFSDKLWAAYQGYFEQYVPNWLQTQDPGRAYIPSSPLSNWGRVENFNHHNMHYWGVWHGDDSLDGFANYIPRFMTEYGFQSWPSPATLRPYILDEDWNRGSPAILHRQKSYKGNAPILRFLKPLYGEPKDFDAFCLLSQYVQREAMTIAIEAQRLKSQHCMGTIYWQLNDCWPGPSWSTINYDGSWKPAHFALNRLYGQYLVTASLANDTIQIRIVSDKGFEKDLRLQVKLQQMDGKAINSLQTRIDIRPETSEKPVLAYPVKSLSLDFPRGASVLTVELSKAGNSIATDLLYFASPKEMQLPKPQFSHATTGGDGKFEILLQAKTLVKDLAIRIDGNAGTFSDNYFDLVPGESKTIQVLAKGVESADELEKLLYFNDLTQVMGQ